MEAEFFGSRTSRHQTALTFIYMVAAEDARDDASVLSAPFVDLGIIKGNIGDQTILSAPI